MQFLFHKPTQVSYLIILAAETNRLSLDCITMDIDCNKVIHPVNHGPASLLERPAWS